MKQPVKTPAVDAVFGMLRKPSTAPNNAARSAAKWRTAAKAHLAKKYRKSLNDLG